MVEHSTKSHGGVGVVESEKAKPTIAFSSVEMIAIGGFGLFFAWMFITSFWLFCEFPPEVSTPIRDLAQFFVFAAAAVSLVFLNFLGKRSQFNIFSVPIKVITGVCAVLMPIVALIMYAGVHVPFAVACIVNALVGFALASMLVSWLDVLSRTKAASYSRTIGLALFAGGLLFSIVAFSPTFLQPVFAIVFAVLSLVLLTFASANADRNDERAPLESVENTWRFTLEIEPSFFMFDVAFGITFVFLFNYGAEKVALGLIATLVGSLAAVIISIADKKLSITVYQRALVVVTVCACLIVPFVEQTGQVICSCVVTAVWALFMSVHYGYVVKKCVIAGESPLFRQAPLRLLFPMLGFAVGWGVAAAITVLTEASTEAFLFMRITVAILLVATIMVFFPSSEHHTADGLSPDGVKVQTTVVAVDKTDTELFEERCAAVAKLYQLSPRETEILGYLARGRNAAYIQEELVISPHTVKSHIYNIYRKLDIHSQQKLMDFVEEFPLD